MENYMEPAEYSLRNPQCLKISFSQHLFILSISKHGRLNAHHWFSVFKCL